MLILLLILVPFIGGLASFLFGEKMAYAWAVFTSLLTLAIAGTAYYFYSQATHTTDLSFDCPWIESIGSTFSLSMSDGLSVLMIGLTGLLFPCVFISMQNKQPERKHVFYGLMLLAQAGLIGVFLAKDALLFYLFWEVALIPVYFLSSMYGGPNRIPVTFKFFVYTFVGSLVMLVALLIIYNHTPVHSFSWDAFVSVGRSLPEADQSWLFWMLFIAFAIKMPVFPFHTWQPDAYEQSATPVTVVLSAIMVKMGLFAVVRWLLPIIPLGSIHWMNVVLLLCIIGVVYASCMAMVQTNIKRLIAYSSIAHIGLMCAAIFSYSNNLLGVQGAYIQMFNHGINIMGLWILVSIVENRLGTQDLREMGGIAKIAPRFTIALVLISLANIALPLTNGFVGEFMMLNGLFNSISTYRMVFTIIAGLGVILSAVYTLGMIQKVAYGELNEKTASMKDLTMNEWIILLVIMGIILFLGFYPNALMLLVDTP